MDFIRSMRGLDFSRATKTVRIVILFFLCMLGAHVTAVYLRYEPTTFVRTIILFLLLLASRFHLKKSYAISSVERIAHIVFSAVLSFVVVLGYHIQIMDAKIYDGLLVDNYINAYTYFDIVAFLIIAAVLYVLLTAMYVRFFQLSRSITPGKTENSFGVCSDPVLVRRVVVYAILILVLWFPWLLTYWPGFVFTDTLSSLAQAIGEVGLSNHHPVIYTLFIKACMRFAESAGLSITYGLGFYSLCQMSFMALCFGYMADWLSVRTGFGSRFAWFMSVIAGISMNLGGYSIAMWKDPMFSAALMMLAPLLFDLCCLNRRVTTLRWLFLFATMSAVVAFLRSNGAYIVGILAVILLLQSFSKIVRSFRYGPSNSLRHARGPKTLPRKGAQLLIVAGILFAILVAYGVVTGPIYSAWGVNPAPKVESLGVPLNQMARVAALDGSMSVSDRAFMDEMLDIEQYSATYRPTCIDMLKWDEGFHGESVGSSEFWTHWLSMFLRNPRTYFEAWELQTCGFWTVNIPAAVTNDGNIGGGMPNNFDTNLRDDWGIEPKNLFGSDVAYELLPYNVWSVPIGVLFWLIVYLIVCLTIRGLLAPLLSLVPSVGLLLTLIIASPIWYWARYGAACQFLIPFYLFLFYLFSIRETRNDSGSRFAEIMVPKAGL